MIEFISEGSNLKEHLRRFEVGGAYENIPKNSWLVVDFRSIDKKVRNPKENTLYVLYKSDFSGATVTGIPLKHDAKIVWKPVLKTSVSSLRLGLESTESTKKRTESTKKRRLSQDSSVLEKSDASTSKKRKLSHAAPKNHCGMRTKKGTKCKNFVTAGKRCHLHK